MNFLHVCLHFLLLASENCSAVNSAADNQKEEQNNHDRFAQELKQKFSQTTHISQVNIDLKYLCTYSSNLLWHHYWGFHEYSIPENAISFESNLWSFMNVSD